MELNKAWNTADKAKNISAKKEAIFELITLQNGERMPANTYNKVWNDLIEEYGKGIIKKLPPSILTKVISLELQFAASEISVKAAK